LLQKLGSRVARLVMAAALVPFAIAQGGNPGQEVSIVPSDHADLPSIPSRQVVSASVSKVEPDDAAAMAALDVLRRWGAAHPGSRVAEKHQALERSLKARRWATYPWQGRQGVDRGQRQAITLPDIVKEPSGAAEYKSPGEERNSHPLGLYQPRWILFRPDRVASPADCLAAAQQLLTLLKEGGRLLQVGRSFGGSEADCMLIVSAAKASYEQVMAIQEIAGGAEIPTEPPCTLNMADEATDEWMLLAKQSQEVELLSYCQLAHEQGCDVPTPYCGG